MLPGFYFHDNHFLGVSLCQPGKDYHIYRAADEPGFGRVVFELGEVGRHLFGELAAENCAALCNSRLPYLLFLLLQGDDFGFLPVPEQSPVAPVYDIEGNDDYDDRNYCGDSNYHPRIHVRYPARL
jgi:hypothetical protein